MLANQGTTVLGKTVKAFIPSNASSHVNKHTQLPEQAAASKYLPVLEPNLMACTETTLLLLMITKIVGMFTTSTKLN
jgi:hypothetical protein